LKLRAGFDDGTTHLCERDAPDVDAAVQSRRSQGRPNVDQTFLLLAGCASPGSGRPARSSPGSARAACHISTLRIASSDSRWRVVSNSMSGGVTPRSCAIRAERVRSWRQAGLASASALLDCRTFFAAGGVFDPLPPHRV
jgi:hypothetical protein